MTSYVISENGSFFSVHSEPAEAETYLDDLKKRWPSSEWELEPIQHGRRKGHERLVWAGTGNWDFVRREVVNFSRAWVFEGELTLSVPNLQPGTLVHRFYTVKSRVNEVEKFSKCLVDMFDRYEASEEPDNHARIILVR